MIARIPAPELVQFADEELIIEMGANIFPGFAARESGRNGLVLTVEGDYMDERAVHQATDKFQILLGALRAWRPIAGQRKDEIRPGIGSGSIRDEHGNQVIKVQSAVAYSVLGAEVEEYARGIRRAVRLSPSLRNALWLNGRRDRNAADFYMIYEYAEKEFGGRKNVTKNLGLAGNQIARLTSSANNLAPLAGGRHANANGVAEWTLQEQATFVGELLRRWADHHSRLA